MPVCLSKIIRVVDIQFTAAVVVCLGQLFTNGAARLIRRVEEDSR